MYRAYAGIGSRETPSEVLETFRKIAVYLAERDYTLRSGGASGADFYFEQGCDSAKGKKEIYLPWKGFENNKSELVVSEAEAFEIAQKYHPNWCALKQGGQKLQARNCHQILGIDLKTPCEFVVCWTKGGKGQGGTGQAIRIATDYGIPIFDFGLEKSREAFKAYLLEKKEFRKS